MRLNFNVLWVDDQPQNLVGAAKRIKSAIAEEGFEFSPTYVTSITQAAAHLRSDVFVDEIDLVLVDYHLGEGEFGDEAIRMIRRAVPYKEIIFYSAVSHAELKQKILEQGIGGIYFSSRNDLPDEVRGVFESLIKKVMDIDHCRGVVMGATSDIDYVVNDCLSIMLPMLSSPHVDESAGYALAKVANLLEHVKESHDSSTEAEWLHRLLSNHRVFTAADRLDLLKKMMTLHHPNEHVDLRKMIGQYRQTIPPKRNELGHVRLIAKDGVRSLEGVDAKPKTLEEMKELRKALITFRKQFDALSELIKGVKEG